VLTDGSGYELTGDGIDVPRPESPVWMVHLGGDFPLGYDDGTLEAIQASGGGVAGSVTEALARLAIGLTQEAAGSTSDLVDGYLWSTVEAGTLTTTSGQELIDHPVSDDFAALAARRLILSRMERQRDNLDQLETLDQLHALAIEHSVVTPYSSMIVLVNREQERLLRQLENRGDRFQREYEEVGETTPENPFDVTGVPEPEEWLLLALAVGMLGWYVYRARQKPAATGSIGVRHLGAK
jgi:putative PEP-CTERM system integral membrane protein